jgi:hypothetical protein
MFVKKDLRKIPTILEAAVECSSHGGDSDGPPGGGNGAAAAAAAAPDPKRTRYQEPLTELRLGRRQQEFRGTLQVLCQPRYVPKLQRLRSLNLYDCGIVTLDGIGSFGATPCLETINLGRNPLEAIPDELAMVQSLKHVWLDDCRLGGSLPRALLRLRNLETLRLPNNRITDIPIPPRRQDDDDDDDVDDDDASTMVPLGQLRILCLDRNQLRSLPSNLRRWTPNLRELLVRNNLLEGPLQCQLPSTLQVLHVSSNRLTSLDALIAPVDNIGGSDDDGDDEESSFSLSSRLPKAQCPHLTHLYANGNELARLPRGIKSLHPNLLRLVVSHNPPLSDVPDEFWEGMISEGTPTAVENDSSTLEILWQPNPGLIPPMTSHRPQHCS